MTVQVVATGSVSGDQTRSRESAQVLRSLESVPVERICRHISGDQKLVLVLPGTAWLQLDTGPRARVMHLGLDPVEAERILENLFRQVATIAENGELATGSSAPGGIGGEDCTLRLTDHGQETVVTYTNLDTLSPELATIDRTLDGLVERIRQAPVSGWSIEQLQIGDILSRRADGVLFEFYGTTGDGAGAELHGISQPLVVIEVLADLPRQYEPVATN